MVLSLICVISRCGVSFSHESNYVFAVLCDMVFGYVVLFAFDVCDFNFFFFFTPDTNYIFAVLCGTVVVF